MYETILSLSQAALDNPIEDVTGEYLDPIRLAILADALEEYNILPNIRLHLRGRPTHIPECPWIAMLIRKCKEKLEDSIK